MKEVTVIYNIPLSGEKTELVLNYCTDFVKVMGEKNQCNL